MLNRKENVLEVYNRASLRQHLAIRLDLKNQNNRKDGPTLKSTGLDKKAQTRHSRWLNSPNRLNSKCYIKYTKPMEANKFHQIEQTRQLEPLRRLSQA
jgi:hypothetical protein